MNFRRLVFIVLLSMPFVVRGHNSLSDSLAWEQSLSRAKLLISHDKQDSARALLRKQLKVAQNQEYSLQEAEIYRQLARSYKSVYSLDSAVAYMEKAWQLAQEEDPDQYGRTMLPSLAYYYWEKGNYSEALENAQEARRHLHALPNSPEMLRLHNILGLIYRDLGNYQRAELHFQNAVRLASRLNKEHYKGVILANMGSLYKKQNRYNEAISYYERGSNIELKYEDYRAAGRSFTVIGELYTDIGNLDQAGKYLEKARYYNTKADDLIGLCRIKNALGHLHQQTEAYERARKFFLQARKLAREKGARKELMKSYQGLYKIAYQTRDYKQAFSYQNRYLKIYQELYSINEIVKLENLQHKLNLQREKNKNQLEQIKKQNTINRLLLAVAILSAVLTALFIFLYYRLRKSKKSLQQKNREIQVQKEKLEKLNEHLSLAKKKAEESEQLKDQFLRNISHEIRTPLNGILGFSSIIAEGEIEKQQRLEYYTFIKRNANLLLSTIDDILDIARIKTQQLRLYKEHFNLQQMARELKKMFSFDKAYHHRDKVEIRIDPDSISPDLTIYSDPAKVRKTLVILMDNAMKFTQEGYIKLEFQPNDGHMQFVVEDTGIGISKEHQNLIYESFRQGEPKLNRNFDGMGAGLSIARSFVEMLGGSLWFESKPQQGTTFYFTIPVDEEV